MTISMKNELPYDFDLHWDVKTFEDVEMIAKAEGHCSDATGDDLVDLFELLEMEVPACLAANGHHGTMDIWITTNGLWYPFPPEDLPRDDIKKANIRKNKFFNNGPQVTQTTLNKG